MREINSIIIHCSDSDIPAHDDVSVIREWHRERGWSDVGYHFFIKSNGVQQEGRPLERTGAHCYGRNSDSIGICLHGRNEFSREQFMALAGLVRSLCNEFNIPFTQVFGHCEFSDKTCPNFDVGQFKREWL
jgi:N-acetyl-anhydromuramyl-L-alanine amidase AmpD